MRRWEDICRCCGKCCHEKIRLDRKSFLLLEAACPHLGPDRRCRIYNNRFKAAAGCRKMTLFRAMFASWLPEDCAYVEWARRHHIRFARKAVWIRELDDTL